MARSIDQVVRDTVGNQAVTIMQLQAELEALQEKYDAVVKKENQEAKVPGEGQEHQAG